MTVATAQPTREELVRREAALARVRKFGDPVLRSRTRPVTAVDAAITAQIRAMAALLDDAGEAGLAAPQVGILNRVFVYRSELGAEAERVSPQAPALALVNPELEWASEETAVDEEGCLSIPGVWILVERPAAVRMRGLDAAGRPVRIEAEEPLARLLQHELDHLDGILTLDRASKADRRAAMRALRGRR
jgi:peptide deformylase